MFYSILSSYYLFKLNQKSKRKSKKEPPTKLLKHRMNNVTSHEKHLCRVCLKEGSFPIFGQKANICEALSVFCDILVTEDDVFPHHLCDSCLHILRSAIIFRQTAKKSNHILKTRKMTEIFELSMEKEEKIDNSNKTVAENKLKKKKKTFEGKAVSYNKADSDNLSSMDNISDSDYREEMQKPVSPSALAFSPVGSESEKNNPDKKIKVKRKTRVKCKICSQIMYKASFKTHYILHDPNKKRYMCDICGKSFHQSNAFRCHYDSHNTEFKYKCDHCPYKSNNPNNLRFHLRVHTREHKYMCTECPKTFRYNSNLHKHMVKHKEPAFSCDYCKKSYYTKPYLERHIQGDHFGQKKHVCHICGSAFTHRKGLSDHFIHIHKFEKSCVRGRMPAYMEAELKKQ